jgi:PST family polysaccharide transporter
MQLGFYGRGYNLMMVPMTQVHSVLTPVLFPAMSSMQHSKSDVRRLYLFAVQGIAVVAFPVMLGLAVVADDFVKVLWGDRWSNAIWIIRVLAIAGVGNSVQTTVGWIYTAMGRTDRMLRATTIFSLGYLICFALGLRWGALGVATAFALAVCIVFWYPQWRMAGSLIDLSFSEAMLNLRDPFVCAVVMAVGVLLLRAALGSALPPAIRLPLSILIGAGIYIGALQIVKVPAYSYIRGRILTATGLIG